uniref:Aquaporin-9 n=1 Tax=Syphacia muris TaxID=451379 RepID=A0A0N5ATS6_9BILA
MAAANAMDRLERLRARLSIKHDLGRGMLGEFIGTGLMTLVGTSVLAQIRLSAGNSMRIDGTRVAGGHLNPAISLMLLSFRQISPLRFFLYFLAQIAGAFIGCAITYIMYYDALEYYGGATRFVQGVNATADIFASYPNPHLGRLNGFIDQMISTAIFCFAFAHIFDKRNAYPNWIRPLLAGLAFVMIGTAFSFNCGFPDNPARDIGGRIFSLLPYGGEVFSYGNRNMNWWFWIPLLAPLLGALLGGWLYQLAIGFHSPVDDSDVEVRRYDVEVTQELKPLTAKGVE